MQTATLGEYLRNARGDRSMTDVTRAGGPPSGNLSQYETGKRLPSVATLKWLCDHYGVSVREAVTLLERARIDRNLREAGLPVSDLVPAAG